MSCSFDPERWSTLWINHWSSVASDWDFKWWCANRCLQEDVTHLRKNNLCMTENRKCSTSEKGFRVCSFTVSAFTIKTQYGLLHSMKCSTHSHVSSPISACSVSTSVSIQFISSSGQKEEVASITLGCRQWIYISKHGCPYSRTHTAQSSVRNLWVHWYVVWSCRWNMTCFTCVWRISLLHRFYSYDLYS